MSDLFYRAFEERNRGSRHLIKSRLVAYLPFIEPLKARGPSPKAIDLGCGRGEWLEILRDNGFDACGVDLDDGMLASCNAHGLDARHADALDTLRDLPSDSIAVVSAFHVVEHIAFDDVRALVREALRVLTPGGLLILETPNPENLNVGTSLFYLDPSHLRPLPPELLSFVVEYEGFHRNVVARLQESAELHKGTTIELINVLAGVSPDYGVIAQKHATAEFLSDFDQPFGASYGITLATIAHRYENQEHSRIDHVANLIHQSNARVEQQTAHFTWWTSNAENREAELERRDAELERRDAELERRDAELERRIEMLENRLIQTNTELLAMRNSRSWRITVPLRWVGNQVRLLRQDGITARVKAMARKIVRPVVRSLIHGGIALFDAHPRLRKQCASLAKRLGLYHLLQPLRSQFSKPKQVINRLSTVCDTSTTELSQRAQKIHQDLKTAIEKNKGHD